MTSKKGRPLKYTPFVHVLENDVLYSPATIVNHGIKQGLIPKDISKVQRKCIRQAMSRLAQRLPSNPEGFVKIKGQEPSRAWYGASWKGLIEDER